MNLLGEAVEVRIIFFKEETNINGEKISVTLLFTSDNFGIQIDYVTYYFKEDSNNNGKKISVTIFFTLIILAPKLIMWHTFILGVLF